MNQVAQEIAQQLLKVNAVKLNIKHPFNWASGWLSPIYCDNRVTLSFPEVRTYICEQLSALIMSKTTSIDMIVGVATAGIPQGALVAQELQLPFGYVRPEPKKHGMKNQFEGAAMPGANVVLIEDLISTGGSSLKACHAVQEMGMNVVAVVAVFSYGFQVAANAFAQANIPLYYLSDYAQLIQVALNNNTIKHEQLPSLMQWRQDPGSWQG